VPLRNRVTPLGDLIATPQRGLVYGNRGCLHDERREIRRRYATKRWIACRLYFRDRRRVQLMAPGRYTELFFLDEATALAAGHRPCAECRRADYNRLGEVWSVIHPGQTGAEAIDDQLHRERIDARTGRRRFHQARYEKLPDGTFVEHDRHTCLVLGRQLVRWSGGGYVARQTRPTTGPATVITPPSLLVMLQAGWTPLVPLIHPSAHGPDMPKLSAPARSALARAGYSTLAQLTQTRESDLAKLHGMGPKAIDRLRESLRQRGLSFKT
jgi:hypothetical protein